MVPRSFVIIASAAVSLLLHGGAVAAALFWMEHRPGAIDMPTEAISIELFRSEVIEAVELSPSAASKASPASVQSDAGAAANGPTRMKVSEQLMPLEPTERVASKETPVVNEAAQSPSQGLDVLQGAHNASDAAGEEYAKPPEDAQKVQRQSLPIRDPAVKDRPRPIKTVKLTEPTVQTTTLSKPGKEGAATSRSIKGTAASSGRLSGSTGSTLNYAAIVRARVASRKPSGSGRRGTVVISFGVSRSGGVSYAGIARSSGDTGLDRSVLSAVRGAGPFPAPPPGANLRFAMPFYFR